MRVNVARTLTLLAALLIPLSVAAAAKMPFEIAAGEAPDALREFGRQARVQLLFEYRLVQDLKTRTVMGDFEREDALAMLLNGTGLTFEFVNERTVAIHSGARTFAETKGDGSGDAAGRINGWLDRFRLAQADQSKRDETPAPSTRSAQSSSETSEKRALEEIIVTARKRTERLQEVPLSIAVVTADDIDRRGLVSAEDYLRGIPGVNQTTHGLNGGSIVIRGIETSPVSQNFYQGTTVATYFGETPTTSSAGVGASANVDVKLVDIERVEVLRGPQGTAFGNSSMGGAVRTIPVAPRLDGFEGKLSAGYSFTSGTGGDNYNVQGVGNLPLIKDKLAIRATAYQYQDSGFHRNVAGSDAAFQAAAVIPYGAQAFAIDKEEVGDYYVLGGRVAALFQASDDLRFTLSYLTQKTEADGAANPNTGPYEQVALQVAPEHVFRGQEEGISDTDVDIVNAMMEYDLGWGNLLATYSYLNSGSMYAFPWTYFGFVLPWPLSTSAASEHRARSGEIRLTTQLDGGWNFLGGIYAEDLDDQVVYDTYWYGSPETNFFAPGLRFMGSLGDRRNLEQKAAFAEVSWEFLPGFTLTGGVRAYDYERTGSEERSGFFYGEQGGTTGADASGMSFRGNLSYKLNDNALVYASWSQGFRLGTPQPGLVPGLCDLDNDGIVDGTNVTIESTKSVDSDDVDNYELGSKFTLLDRRLTIAADVYRIDWSGVPVLVLAPCENAYLANAGAARSEGIEFQANFYATKAFRIDVGGSWINARLSKDVPAQGFSDGDRLPGSPEFNANLGLQYEFEIGAYKAFVRADSIYVGSFYGDILQSANTKSGDYVKLDATARVAIENLNIDLYVRNLTNEDAFTFRSVFDFGDFWGYRLRPRTIGLQLRYNF